MALYDRLMRVPRGSFWALPFVSLQLKDGVSSSQVELGASLMSNLLYHGRGTPCCLGRNKEGVGMAMGKIMAFLNQGRLKVLRVPVLGHSPAPAVLRPQARGARGSNTEEFRWERKVVRGTD